MTKLAKLTKMMRVALYVRDNPSVNALDVSEVFDITDAYSGKILRELMNHGVLVRSGSDGYFRYTVAPGYVFPEFEFPDEPDVPEPQLPEALPAHKEKSAELESKAAELESRGLRRRAATLLTDALKYQRTEKDVWRICQLRKTCLVAARRASV